MSRSNDRITAICAVRYAFQHAKPEVDNSSIRSDIAINMKFNLAYVSRSIAYDVDV